MCLQELRGVRARRIQKKSVHSYERCARRIKRVRINGNRFHYEKTSCKGSWFPGFENRETWGTPFKYGAPHLWSEKEWISQVDCYSWPVRALGWTVCSRNADGGVRGTGARVRESETRSAV